jgi:hypothetical protein
MMNKPLSTSMLKAIEDAKKYGNWFSPAFSKMSPVRCGANTAKALVKLGIFEAIYILRQNSGNGEGNTGDWMYRYKGAIT